MAEVQDSGPSYLKPYSPDQFIAAHVNHVGIASDYTGNAFALTLPSGSDVATVGPGWAQVGAHGYTVPSGQAQDITIPPSTNAALGRTDLITLRYQASWDGVDPGPVRIHRVAGVEGSGDTPIPDLGLSVGENQIELPLYAITRIEGDTLDDAAVQDLRIWKGPNLLVAATSPLYSAPLGSRVVRDGTIYRRGLVSGVASWVVESSPVQTLTGLSATAAPSDPNIGNTEPGWQRQSSCRLVRDGTRRWLHLVSRKGGSNIRSHPTSGHILDQHLATLHTQDRPPVEVSPAVTVRSTSGNTFYGGGVIYPSGNAYVTSWAPDVVLGPGGPDDAVVLDAVWWVAS